MGCWNTNKLSCCCCGWSYQQTNPAIVRSSLLDALLRLIPIQIITEMKHSHRSHRARDPLERALDTLLCCLYWYTAAVMIRCLRWLAQEPMWAEQSFERPPCRRCTVPYSRHGGYNLGYVGPYRALRAVSVGWRRLRFAIICSLVRSVLRISYHMT